jgi:outer membrane protein assembly factor BamB
MLVERDGIVFFGTRNGVVYAVDPKTQLTKWAHKVDNSMVNTVRVLNKRDLVVTTMDGRLLRLRFKGDY